ncbi:hypothetical protein LXL04_001315 [Taraxacum kok-saghyz]
MSFEIGETVEVIGNEDGMELRGPTLGARYQNLLANDGSPLEEVISVRRLRPPPPTVLARFHLGDMVDAWHNEGWWVGMTRGKKPVETMEEKREENQGIGEEIIDQFNEGLGEMT